MNGTCQAALMRHWVGGVTALDIIAQGDIHFIILGNGWVERPRL